MKSERKRAPGATGRHDLDRFKARWRELHGDVELTPVVNGWLNISFRIAKFLDSLHLTPNALSLTGGALSLASFIAARSWIALFFLALSLIADGVDGSLAIFQSRESLRGALIDSTIDRISEFFWVLAMIRLDGNLIWILLVYILALTQEYVRARLLGVGDFETGVVTVGERPHRVIYLALVIIAYHYETYLKWSSHNLLNALLVAWSLIQAISLVMVLRNAYSQIARADRLSN